MRLPIRKLSTSALALAAPAAVVALAALTAATLAPVTASAAVVPVQLFIRAGTLTTVDARSLPVLCYADAELGPVTLPPPVLRVKE